MNATIGYLAYGLSPLGLDTDDPMLLAAGAYTPSPLSWELQMEAAHAGCHISAFCRNPLHPGPCKGWKHHLGLVSPGALHALEKVRHEKLEERRKAKVKALQDAGHAVPKSLLTPIVYDPAKNKYLNNIEHGKVTPGLGIPTQGLTPEAAKKTLENIPTKAEVGAKLDAKHAAEAAAAVPKPTEKPTMLTISKAGLKDGDKVFLHGVVNGGTPTLVTVQKKPKGYQFVDDKGNVVHAGGGASTKWALSPAPGHAFPGAGAPETHKTTPGQVSDVLEAKHAAQATAIGKVANQAMGKHPTDAHMASLKEHVKVTEAAGKPVVDEAWIDTGSKKIAGKLWTTKPEIQDKLHQGDLENALKKDIEDGALHGKPTPVLDVAKEAGVSLGQDKPGAVQALVDAVHAKLGISGHEETPHLQDVETALGAKEAGKGLSVVQHAMLDHAKKTIEGKNDNLSAESRIGLLTGLNEDTFHNHLDEHEKKAFLSALANAHAQLDSKPDKNLDEKGALQKAAAKYEQLSGKKLTGGNHLANVSNLANSKVVEEKSAASEDPFAGLGANVGAAPHVKQAIAYANGHTAATDTKKLAAYQKLTPDELKSLDPNTQKLMAANLGGMHKKFLDPKKKATVQDVLGKLQVAQGGGAGAGGVSVGHPAPGASTDHKMKAELGASAATFYEHLAGHTGFNHKPLQNVLEKTHAAGTAPGMAEMLANDMAKNALAVHEPNLSAGAIEKIHPHLAAEMKQGLLGEAKPGSSPLANALFESSSGNVGPLKKAVESHPGLGPHVFGESGTSAKPDAGEVASKLALHAGAGSAIGTIKYQHEKEVAQNGPQVANSFTAANLGATKTTKALKELDLPKNLSDDLDYKIGGQLEEALQKDYEHALSNGLSEPTGVASKIDDIVSGINDDAVQLAIKNGWKYNSPALQTWKHAVAEQKIKALLESNPGEGGHSSHVSPAASAAAPSVVAPSLPKTSKPYVAPPAAAKNDKGVIVLKHAQALKVVSMMKSFPEGQYLESPEPKIWDNLVAISAHEGITPMQALTTLDEQNSKKLGVTNANLLEKKVRAWLATPDGKAYADANKTPKAPLAEHLKKKDSGKSIFSHSTGITLPPGEKIQKLGGPGAFDEHKSEADFGKYTTSKAEADQNKFKSENGISFTKQQLAGLTEYVNGSHAINSWLRDEGTPSQQSIDNAIHLQSMMMPTTRDHLLLRGTGWSQFPPEARSYEGLQKLVGETLEEPAFLSASVSGSASGFGGSVKMHIQAPAGTMGVFTKDKQYHSQFLGSEAELLLAAKTELKVLKVWKEGGQVQVLMRVVS